MGLLALTLELLSLLALPKALRLAALCLPIIIFSFMSMQRSVLGRQRQFVLTDSPTGVRISQMQLVYLF